MGYAAPDTSITVFRKHKGIEMYSHLSMQSHYNLPNLEAENEYYTVCTIEICQYLPYCLLAPQGRI